MAISDLVFPTLAAEPVNDVWEALKAILRASPHLQAVRTWRLWEGDVDDAEPPTMGQMPWVRVTPLTAPMSWFDEASHRVDLTFKYELVVEGMKMRNLIFLYGAFRRSLNLNAPVGDSTAMRVLADVGALVHEFRTAAIGPVRVREVDPDNAAGPPPPRNLGSSGTFVLSAVVSAIS